MYSYVESMKGLRREIYAALAWMKVLTKGIYFDVDSMMALKVGVYVASAPMKGLRALRRGISSAVLTASKGEDLWN